MTRTIMLHRIGMIGVAALLTAVLGGGVAIASSSSAGSPKSAGEQGRTFKLAEFETSFVKEDGGSIQKVVAGALFMLHSVLKTPDGKEAGVADFMCTDLSTGPRGVFHCSGTDTFTDGSTIEWSGLGKIISLDFTVSVTGGTGRYSGAEGELAFHSLNADGTKVLDTFKLDG